LELENDNEQILALHSLSYLNLFYLGEILVKQAKVDDE